MSIKVALEHRTTYDFAEPGFIERLIARLHSLGDLREPWRRGAVFVVDLDETCGVCEFAEVKSPWDAWPVPWDGSARLRVRCISAR